MKAFSKLMRRSKRSLARATESVATSVEFALIADNRGTTADNHKKAGRFKSCLFSCFVVKSDIVMAKKNNTKRKLVGLVSEESGVRAYYTKKNTMNTPDKLSLKKYDPVLRKHVLFVETKKNLGRNEVKEKKR